MSMTFADVKPDTPCPTVHGGLLHYPRTTVSGQPITMPFGEKRAYGIQQYVMLSLCGGGYLVPPRDGEAKDQQRVHAACNELLRGQRAAVEDRSCGDPVELSGSGRRP
ncbi:hypothetical protein [Saccharopolyspora rectivirgula]|uniref:hypothetical protein n=1 Tax=Saccharopolyspora rectivirgula TaxID=28042 RepID=UPI0012681E43|nr:hypothetical protein [Saccharopolyspora rectivirgula]